ncbi:hypothetical protein [Solibaculum mannosilyticum]|uniref:Ig-like domain-containing protein n=1 Tax=Solibaculum mannosilyticum TaxID=2780922 RepID=A0A7I8D2B7_9FIRM|nr:hypothetical protein [Solibaculum mannosilyticum]BCI60916.1 hypothetical protein C12CBH8_15550 [Solibaculum mannosilyticum]
MKKRIVAGVFALAVVATLAVTGSAARTVTKYNGPVTFNSTLSAPSPNYTTFYTSRITPPGGGSYKHSGTLYTSSGSKEIAGSSALYTNSTPGISMAVNTMSWYTSSMGTYVCTTTVEW